MPAGIVCPLDGTRLTRVDSLNSAGDRIHRWKCPIDTWTGPWYSGEVNGETNEPLPELLRDVEFIANVITTVISGIPTVDPVDDYDSFQAIQQTLVASTDTTFVFNVPVRAVRVSNWNTSARVLVKDGAIISDTDAASAPVGKAPAADVPNQMWFPFATSTIHLRSSVAAEVTVEGYFGSV